DISGRGRGRPVLPEGIAAEQPAERHRLGLIRLTRRQCDGYSLGPPLRSRGGSGQIADSGARGPAQPLQVGLALGACAGRQRIGRCSSPAPAGTYFAFRKQPRGCELIATCASSTCPVWGAFPESPNTTTACISAAPCDWFTPQLRTGISP